jgi:hypothetical protein
VGSRHGPGGPSDEDERFARALEASALDSPDGRAGEIDGEFDAELAVVELLRGSRERLDADELTSARVRSRVLASSTAARQARHRRPLRGSLRGRLAGAAAAVLCLALALAGLSALGARNAGPGQSLAGSPSAVLHTPGGRAGDDMSQGIRYTELASSRVDEASGLLGDGSASVHDYEVALDQFDSEVRAAARSFHDVDAGSRVSALRKLRDWAATAAARLSAMRENVPRGARERVAASAERCRRVEDRAEARLRHLTAAAPRSSDAARQARPGTAGAAPITSSEVAPRESAPAGHTPAAPPNPRTPRVEPTLGPRHEQATTPPTDHGTRGNDAHQRTETRHGIVGNLVGGVLGLLGGG